MKIKTLFAVCLSIIGISAAASADSVTFGDGRILTRNHDVWCSANGAYVDFNSNGIPFYAYTETLPEGQVNYVPIRTVSEALGLIVGYNAETKGIELRSADRILILTQDSSYATVYDTSYNLIEQKQLFASQTAQVPCSVRNINDTTYIPIRAVTETFGFSVGWQSGQIILTNPGLTPIVCEPDKVSKAIEIYGEDRELRIANAPSPGFNTYKEKNGLTDLTGYLLRTRAEGMWIIGIPESRLEYYDKVIAPKYFNDTYYKTSQNTPWQSFTDEVSIRSVYDVSCKMTTVTGAKSVSFEDTDEISDEKLRGAMAYFRSRYGNTPKIVLEEYPASFASFISGATEDATLYQLMLPYEQNAMYYVLCTDSGCSMLDSSAFGDGALSEDITLTFDGLGTLTVFCDIVIVDILDA